MEGVSSKKENKDVLGRIESKYIMEGVPSKKENKDVLGMKESKCIWKEREC